MWFGEAAGVIRVRLGRRRAALSPQPGAGILDADSGLSQRVPPDGRGFRPLHWPRNRRLRRWWVVWRTVNSAQEQGVLTAATTQRDEREPDASCG